MTRQFPVLPEGWSCESLLRPEVSEEVAKKRFGDSFQLDTWKKGPWSLERREFHRRGESWSVSHEDRPVWGYGLEVTSLELALEVVRRLEARREDCQIVVYLAETFDKIPRSGSHDFPEATHHPREVIRRVRYITTKMMNGSRFWPSCFRTQSLLVLETIGDLIAEAELNANNIEIRFYGTEDKVFHFDDDGSLPRAIYKFFDPYATVETST